MAALNLEELLRAVARGEISPADAQERIASAPAREALASFARIDHDRQSRTGAPETIFASGKSPDEVLAIAREMLEVSGRFLATRVEPECAALLGREIREARHDEVARLVSASRRAQETPRGDVVIVTGGTSDLPVAREALLTLEHLGDRVTMLADVGVAGLHRILGHQLRLRSARAVIVAAGMEGALASVVAGLVPAPVVALPTSVGYGASAGGLAALLAMLSSCAPGIAVVNIDNGFGAACLASRINRDPPDPGVTGA